MRNGAAARTVSVLLSMVPTSRSIASTSASVICALCEEEGDAVGAVDLAPVLVVAVALLDVGLARGGLRVPVGEPALRRIDAQERAAKWHVARAIGEGAPLLAPGPVGREAIVEAHGEGGARARAPVGDVPEAVGVEEVVERDDLVHRGEKVVEAVVELELEKALGRRRLVLPV